MSEIRVDTISEKTSANGVSIDGLTIKDGNINESVKIVGTTPTLTIGDAGAEDAKIVFDGNAQDYHIGLDDSVDDLIIGKGSALGTTPAITINENSQTTIAKHVNPPPSFRNMITNGAMSISQRGTSFANLGNGDGGTYTLDRFAFFEEGDFGGAEATISRDTDVPTGQGFANSLKVVCATVDTSIDANTINYISQKFEGQMLQHLAKGTSGAKSTTLSFWSKSNLTGTFTINLVDQDTTNQRLYSASYSPSSANTWEKFIINIPADTTGALNNNNGPSFRINWNLQAGSNKSNGTLTSAWEAEAQGDRAVGQTNFYSSTSNNWYITGVQWEVGDTATDFEHLPHDIVMNRCLRYFESNYDYEEGDVFPAEDVNYGNVGATYQGHGYAADVMRSFIPFKVRKRGIPTMVFYRVDGLADGGIAGRWDFFDGTWQQMAGATAVGEATETGVDINLLDGDIEATESFLIAGGWQASSEI